GHKPISALKSFTGHGLGACASFELWATINMMNEGWFAPTLNLDNVDERCADLEYIAGKPRDIQADTIMSNNFAFGGINTSLIVRSAASVS
ncbi:MAG: beta-ketoacyl-ACP synthase, partial [Pseudomonadota bacterium]